MNDCIFLLPCIEMEGAFRGFFGRPAYAQRLGTGQFDFDSETDIIRAPFKDPDVWSRGHELLRPYIRRYRYAVVVLDAAWDGAPAPAQLADDIQRNLDANGWAGRSAVIVIQPELEAWIWQDNTHVEVAFGHDGNGTLRARLEAEGWWPQGQEKPSSPKECALHVLKGKGIQMSSALYEDITSRVSVKNCTDAAFLNLRAVLQEWFS